MASFVDENISPNQCFSLPKPVDGYPKLADHMGSSPEISIFKRFVALNRQNLLYLQAELTSLERRLRNVEAHSANCDPTDPRSHYSRDWEWMKITDEKSTLNPQWQLFGQIRGVLKEYNEALLQQAALSALPQPDAYNIGYLQHWLSHPSCGNFPLVGPDRTIWKEAPLFDLVALGKCQSTDPFSRWVVNSFIPCYHGLIGHRFRKPHQGSHSNSVEYNSAKIMRVVSVIATVVAAILIIAPVAVLYEISNMRVRLGAMAGFTVLFSLCMTGLTSAKRSEIFAATAAFAAVQVVFIGSSISSR